MKKNVIFIFVFISSIICFTGCEEVFYEDGVSKINLSGGFSSNVVSENFNHTPHNDPDKYDRQLADKILPESKLNHTYRFKLTAIGSYSGKDFLKEHPDAAVMTKSGSQSCNSPSDNVTIVYTDREEDKLYFK